MYSPTLYRKLPWMSDSDRISLVEISERLSRRLEDLDSSISRTAVIADEITSMMADAMNRRHIPCHWWRCYFAHDLLTGLFGVNLGDPR